jgi:uncharacterized protein (DUF3084 family)
MDKDLIGFIISAFPGIAAILVVILDHKKTRAEARKIQAEAHKIQDESDKIEEEKERVKAEKEKIRAEAAAIIQKAAFDLNEQYKKRMEEMEQDTNRRIRLFEKNVTDMKKHLGKVESLVRDVLSCLMDTVEGANKLFKQVTVKHKDAPEYTPPSIELVQGKRKKILRELETEESES